MSGHLDAIAPQIVPRAAVGGEVTSTFGKEAVDDAVEQIVAELTRTLMDSDHVEDVFAEDNVIQRDIFRVVRDALLHRDDEGGDEDDEVPIRVRLDTLGYVASTVSKLASASMLRETLERAADAVLARLIAYNAPTQEATFVLEGGGPDQRLEIEEAVADELSELVDDGLIELPTIERRIELERETTARERSAARARIELAAVKTIMRSGCAAAWEFVDPRAVKVTFTPLSEQDALDIDPYIPAFARELAAIFATGAPTSGATQAGDAEKASEAADVVPPVHAAPEATKKPKTEKASARPSTQETAAPRRKASSRPSASPPARTSAAADKPAKRTKAAAARTKAVRAPAAKKPKPAAKKRSR